MVRYALRGCHPDDAWYPHGSRMDGDRMILYQPYYLRCVYIRRASPLAVGRHVRGVLMKSGVFCRKIVGLAASSNLRHLTSTAQVRYTSADQGTSRISNTHPSREPVRAVRVLSKQAEPKLYTAVLFLDTKIGGWARVGLAEVGS